MARGRFYLPKITLKRTTGSVSLSKNQPDELGARGRWRLSPPIFGYGGRRAPPGALAAEDNPPAFDQAASLFRKNIDPAHFYITVASVCYFPISNAATLKAFLGVDINSKKDLALRLDYAKRAALGSLLCDAK